MIIRKNAAELEGIRRAQTAADAGMAAAAEMLRSARVEDHTLALDGETLTSERVRDHIREVCAGHGAPAGEDIIVAAGPDGATSSISSARPP